MKIIYSVNRKKEIFEIFVDDEDYEYLNQFTWRVSKFGYVRRQTSRKLGKQKGILMHREIMGVLDKPDILIDHIKRNPLNNQRSNLRTCNHNENARNRTGRGKSKYLGVSFYPNIRLRYKVTIWINKKSVHLGYFAMEEEAARAYDKAAKEHFGEFANLNFKD